MCDWGTGCVEGAAPFACVHSESPLSLLNLSNPEDVLRFHVVLRRADFPDGVRFPDLGDAHARRCVRFPDRPARHVIASVGSDLPGAIRHHDGRVMTRLF